MDPELRKKIEGMEELIKENSQILKGLRSAQRWGNFMRFLYWMVIIGVSVGAFYYIQPYFEQVLGVYSSGVDTVSKFQEFQKQFTGKP